MEHISNEKKADEICKRHIFDSNHYDCCMEMADWKQQQMIDKAAEWVENYLFEIGYPDDWLRDSPNIKNGKTRFIQAMKRE